MPREDALYAAFLAIIDQVPNIMKIIEEVPDEDWDFFCSKVLPLHHLQEILHDIHDFGHLEEDENLEDHISMMNGRSYM